MRHHSFLFFFMFITQKTIDYISNIIHIYNTINHKLYFKQNKHKNFEIELHIYIEV